MDQPPFPHLPFFADEEDMKAAIDMRSGQLIDEFYEHLAEYRQMRPEAGQREVYEGWSIQKLAGLQVMMMDLYERLNLIAAHTPKRRR